MASKRKLNGYALTDEQDKCVSTALRGLDMVIRAFAGAGKTSTLEAITRYHPEEAIYIAFNSTIAKEAQKRFPEHVKCMTAHSLAFDAVVKRSPKMKAKLEAANGGKRLSNKEIEEALNIGASTIGSNKNQLMVAIVRTLTNFLQSADTIVGFKHVSDKVFTWSQDEKRRHEIAIGVRDYATALWNMMQDPNHPMGITHDGYLKIYQLRGIRIPANLLLLDEAQDSNPVLLDIVSKQSCQKIFVGDKHQSIYAWRGAVDAMDKLDYEQLYLTQSFRFGDNIAKLANVCLKWKEEKMPLQGLGKPKPVENPQEVWMCRTNLSIFTKAIDAINQRKKVHIVGGVDEIAGMIEGAFHLKNGQAWKCKAPELSEFNSWEEMKQYAEESEDIDINRLIKFVETHQEKTPDKVRSLKQTINVDEAEADVIFSTVHKAKGREWPVVRLADDFKLPTDVDADGAPKLFTSEDMNILYVAVTRGMNDVKLSKKQYDYLVAGKQPLQQYAADESASYDNLSKMLGMAA